MGELIVQLLARQIGLIWLFPLAAQASNGLNLIGYGAEWVALGGTHSAIAGDTSVSNRFIPVGGFGHVRRPKGSDCARGVASFGQGGAGVVYENLNTLFGSVYELSSQVPMCYAWPGSGDSRSLG